MVNEPFLPQDLLQALNRLAQTFDRRGIRYALIGGVATGFRSHPRFTLDLDFLLDVPQLALPGLLEELKSQGFQFDEETVIREWAREHMTSLAYRSLLVDWLKPVLSCYRLVLDQARTEDWQGHSVRIASAEGLILTKLIAFRGQDQVDIENLLAANRDQLDLDLIRREWQALAPAGDPRSEKFEAMVLKSHSQMGQPGS